MAGTPWPPRGEDGFTLVELLIGIAIAGVLIGVIGSAMVVGLKTTDATTQRLSESHDAQVSSAYLANDVQSASAVNVSGSTASCASAPTDLVTFTYKNGQTATYRCGTTSGQTQVTRTFGGSTLVIAHFAGNARPSVSCTPSPCSATPPDALSISFAESSGFAYSLLGARRAFNVGGGGNGTGTSAEVTLFVLGGGSPLWVSGSCPKGQIQNGTCSADSEEQTGQPTTPKLTVLGNLYVNTAQNGAVRISGKKSDVKLDVEQNAQGSGGDFKILAGGTCNGCTKQTVVCPHCSTDPPPGSYAVPLLDPLRFMTAPVETGLPVYSDGNYHGPGVYTTKLGIQANTTFASGIYVLNNGMSVTGSSNVSSAAGGVLLYNKNGDVSFGGSSTINLAPMASGQYKGLLMFQARSNTNPITLAGGTGVSPIGIIYAPVSSGVTLGTGGATLRVTAVIAQNIKVSGSSQVIIG
jgi:prepilin-type N-terminal cleavage/methylation domain-containing protein